MAKYTYRCVQECLRGDLSDILGFEGQKRFRVGDVVESPREIDSPKFELAEYQPDPPKKATAKPAAKKE